MSARHAFAGAVTLSGALIGSLAAYLLGSEQISRVDNMSTTDPSSAIITPYFVPPSLGMIVLGAIIGATLAGLLARRLLRR